MGGRLVISTTSDEVARDLAQKLVLFPYLPWILVNRAALKFRELGREQALSGSGPTTLGSDTPWAPGSPKAKSKYLGQAREKSFIYSANQTKKYATVSLSHPLANIWEAPVGSRRVKRVIPFLSTFAKKFKSMGIAEQVVAEALENIARDGKP